MTELAIQDSPPNSTPTPPANPFFEPKPPKPEEGELPQQGMAKEQLTLDEGPVMLIWPPSLGEDSVNDLSAWLDVVIKRAKRKAGITGPDQESQQQ